MTDQIHIDNIERFLRGQMTQQEEIMFKYELKSNKEIRYNAYIITSLVKSLRTMQIKE